MSQATRISISYPPPPATKAKDLSENCDLLSDAVSNSTDGSHLLFSMYNEKAMEADKKLISDWAKDAESIMLVGGLISATVSTFLSQIYLATSSDTSLGALVIALWFGSLGSSLTSVVLANLVQGWIRRYTAMTQPQHSSDNEARNRAYVLRHQPLYTFQTSMNGVRLLLDVSVYFLLAGLCFLTVDRSDHVSLCMVLWGAFPLLVWYAWSTVNSLFHPSYTVFSTPMSDVVVASSQEFKRLLSALWMVRRRQVHDPDRVISHDWLMFDQAAHLTERLVKSDSLSLDREIVNTILKSLNQGHELERFLASIPSFYRSAHVQEPAQVFRPFSNILSNGIVSFIDHTLSSQTLPNETKQDRIKLSLQVMDVDPYLLQRTFFYALTRATQPVIFQCVDFVLVADRSVDNGDQATQLFAKCIIAVAISHLKDHQPDPRLSRVFERWLNPAIFANTYRMKMINLVRLARVLNSAGHANWDEIFGKALLAVAEFEVESSAGEYRMGFCNLWNQLLEAASADGDSNASHILPHIHNLYTALHGGTAPNKSSTHAHDSIQARYTRCTISTHYLTPRPTSTPNLKIARGSGEAHTLRRRFSLPSHVGLPAV